MGEGGRRPGEGECLCPPHPVPLPQGERGGWSGMQRPEGKAVSLPPQSMKRPRAVTPSEVGWGQSPRSKVQGPKPARCHPERSRGVSPLPFCLALGTQELRHFFARSAFRIPRFFRPPSVKYVEHPDARRVHYVYAVLRVGRAAVGRPRPPLTWAVVGVPTMHMARFTVCICTGTMVPCYFGVVTGTVHRKG